MLLEFLNEHEAIYSYLRGKVIVSCRCGKNLGKHDDHESATNAFNNHKSKK